MAAGLQAEIDQLLAGLQLTGPDALEVATLHEQVQSLLAQAKYREARQKAEELLREQAIATTRRVLETDPQNVHALSNLARYLYLSGRTEEAHPGLAVLVPTLLDRGDPAGREFAARSWLNMREKTAPESPHLRVYRQKLRFSRWRQL